MGYETGASSIYRNILHTLEPQPYMLRRVGILLRRSRIGDIIQARRRRGTINMVISLLQPNQYRPSFIRRSLFYGSSQHRCRIPFRHRHIQYHGSSHPRHNKTTTNTQDHQKLSHGSFHIKLVYGKVSLFHSQHQCRIEAKYNKINANMPLCFL